jgi:hypothetical protein
MSYLINNNTSNAIFLNSPSTSVTSPASTYTINTGTGIGVSNGTSWAQTPMTVKQSGLIELKGDDADIVVNGKSLGDAIAAIESRLAMLTPNTKLEAEWTELKRLGDEYRALEKDINEKMKTWDILKRED